MAQIEEAAAQEGPFPITRDYSNPFAEAVCKSENLAEEGKYGEAAQVLSPLMTQQLEADWKQILETRIRILKTWDASKHIDLKDYRTFYLETGIGWFHERTRPIAALWKMELGSEVERCVLIGELLAAKRDFRGQVIVLSAIPDIGGVEANTAAKSLFDVGNVLYELGEHSGAETNWSKVMILYPGSPTWPEAVLKLGILCKEAKRYPEAIAFFDKLLKSKPNGTAARGIMKLVYADYLHRCALELSQCYEALNDYSKALQFAREAKTEYPFVSFCGMDSPEYRQRLEQRIMDLERKLAKQGTSANVDSSHR
jgi:tetratricopeptide (TPR) repeat protein